MKQILKFYPLCILLIFYFVFSFLSYKSIPISSDEEFRYTRGKEQLNFYLKSETLQNFFLPSILPNQYYFYVLILNIFNPNFYYEWFHLGNLLFAASSLVIPYFILYDYCKKIYLSLLSPIAILLTPSFSGHMGFNPVDIPFANLLLFNLYLIYKFQNIGFSLKKILILGFSSFMLLGLRPLGFQFFILYIFFHLLKFKIDANKKLLIDQFKNLILISFVSMFLIVITWPYLGINFFKNLPNILSNTASFTNWNNLLIFEGNFIDKTQRPWYYLFTYISLTTPLFILVFFIFSIFNLKNLLKSFLIFILFFNLILYLIINPVIYNGLRHFLYLIPIIVIIACFGFIDFLYSSINKNIKYVFFLISFLSLLYSTYYTYKLYPNHYSFFNEISGGVENNIYKYDTDYWGGSYKLAAEYIRDNLVKSPNPYDLKVYTCNLSYAMDYYSHKKFIMTINRDSSDLIVCSAPEDSRRGYQGQIVHTIKLGNEPYIIIRKNLK